MRTTIDVDDGLLAEAKVVAARTHRTLSAVVNDSLRTTLSRVHASEPGRVTLPTDGAGGLRPGIDLDDREALAERLGDNEAVGGLDAPA